MMYDASVPLFTRMLGNLSKILAKAEGYAAKRRIDPAVLLQARLYPNMFPLMRQAQVACDHAKGATARLAGIEPPRFADDEASFAELLDRIEKVLGFIGEIPAEAMDEAASRTILLKLGSSELSFVGKDYLFSFALPNFFFHLTTAYDILRHNGLDLGKRDYLA